MSEGSFIWLWKTLLLLLDFIFIYNSGIVHTAARSVYHSFFLISIKNGKTIQSENSLLFHYSVSSVKLKNWFWPLFPISNLMLVSNIQQSKNSLCIYFDFNILFSSFCAPEVMLLSALRVKNSVNKGEYDGVQQLLS